MTFERWIGVLVIALGGVSALLSFWEKSAMARGLLVSGLGVMLMGANFAFPSINEHVRFAASMIGAGMMLLGSYHNYRLVKLRGRRKSPVA